MILSFKKHFTLSIIGLAFISLLFQGCSEPLPDFYMEPTNNPESYETINFFNQSVDALSYEWVFGDGDTSEEENPEHVYQWPGTYTVTLTASDERSSNTTTKSITINDPTVLYLEFYSSDQKSAIGDCEVWLYDNENDWQELNRAQIYSYATFNGKCYFLNLEDQIYYVRVYKYTDTGVWEGSGVMSKLTLNETTNETVYCNYTPYVE